MTAPATLFLAPDPDRVSQADAVWRARLGGSFGYLGDFLAGQGVDVRARMAALSQRVTRGPVSPWTSCLYARLVADITKRERPPLDWLFDGLEQAIERPSRDDRVMRLGDPDIPKGWWSQLMSLIDTDRALPFRPRAASEPEAAAAIDEIAACDALLARADPAFLGELKSLAPAVVLAAPETDARSDDFGAVSSFFMRGLVVLNAAKRRSAVLMADALVHEASHILLFGLSTEQPLTTDRGETRYASAARPDPRPIDGIFHAAYVSTRVHLLMTRMLASGALSANEAAEAERRLARNADVAQGSLGTLVEHAEPTPVGERVLSGLSAYWSEASNAAGVGYARSHG